MELIARFELATSSLPNNNNMNTIACSRRPQKLSWAFFRLPFRCVVMYDVTAYALNVLAREAFKEKLSVFPQEGLKSLIDNASWQTEKISLIKKECHQYDQEWRMLLPTPYTNRPHIKFRPKSVLIGLRTPEYQRRLIISAARIAGIKEIYQVVINDDNLLGKQKISEE